MIRPIGFLLLLLATAPAAFPQSVGGKYGTRDPLACPSTKEPQKGPITPAKATEYVMCGYEVEQKSSDELWLVDVQQVEVGKPRAFDVRSDHSQADPKELVYPIRGKIVKYMCRQLRYVPDGKNCASYDQPAATGTCIRTSFGDWKCLLQGPNANQQQGPGPKK